MIKPKIFISAPYLYKDKKYLDIVKSNKDIEVVLIDVEERLEENDLLELFKAHPNIISGIVGDDQFTQKVYKEAINLKSLVKWGTGIDSLNKDIANTFNVKIYNTPSAFTIPVSESAIGMMLSFCRKIHESNISMTNSIWEKIDGFTLNESSVGIIGLGNIGMEVANKLKMFGSKINFYDPNKNSFNFNKYEDLHEMINDSDIITIHCDLNESSKHLISKKELDLLYNKILINTARGAIINFGDISEEHLQNIYFGFDVFEKEPNFDFPRNSTNMLTSAHNTNTSPKYWENIHLNSIKMMLNSIKND